MWPVPAKTQTKSTTVSIKTPKSSLLSWHATGIKISEISLTGDTFFIREKKGTLFTAWVASGLLHSPNDEYFEYIGMRLSTGTFKGKVLKHLRNNMGISESKITKNKK